MRPLSEMPLRLPPLSQVALGEVYLGLSHVPQTAGQTHGGLAGGLDGFQFGCFDVRPHTSAYEDVQR